MKRAGTMPLAAAPAPQQPAGRAGLPRAWRNVLAIALTQALVSGAFAQRDDNASGRRIYLEGRTASGEVTANRAGSMQIEGAAAACVNCHRRSTLGGAEGRSYVPPIDAQALFSAKAPGTGAAAAGIGRAAYTETTLHRALGEGIDPSGRQLDYLMPRYALDAEQVRSLMAYLREVSDAPVAGIDDSAVHLATVVAGDVSPEQRRITRDTLQACVAEHNAGPPAEGRRKRLAQHIGPALPRPWTLHVWELSGAAQTWDAQLRAHAQRQPVFAMLGGVLGTGPGDDWAPVHQFCEREAMPCLYPHLEMPPTAQDGFYALYTSGGVRLEAALIAHHLHAQTPRRVVQWLRGNDSTARVAAQALSDALRGQGFDVLQRRIEDVAPMEGVREGNSMGIDAPQVLWLRADDLLRFGSVALNSSPALYLSSSLLGHELHRVPGGLRRDALVASPHEVAQARVARTRQLTAWLAKQRLSLHSEALQADAYLACDALRHGMNEVTQRPGADYLIERLEALTERRGFAGFYPRLSLGNGQRVASKTGYLVRFSRPGTNDVEPLGDAVAP